MDTKPRTMFSPRRVLRCPRGAPWAVPGEQGETWAVFPPHTPDPHLLQGCGGKAVLFEACLGFVSKDDCLEPFIATVWDSLPGPAPILQGIFQKAKAALCNCKGTLPAEVKGEKGAFPL